MKVEELFSSIRNTLQDTQKTYWDDSELLSYYNECVRNMSAERLENKTEATLILDPTKNEYDTTGILRYIRAKDNDGTNRTLYPNDESGEDDNLGVIIEAYNRVHVNDPTLGGSLTIQVIALPEDSNLSSSVRIGDESALKYYVLSKAYEKDTDVENFQKSAYFYQKYLDVFKTLKDSSSLNYKSGNAERTTAYYY